MIVVVGGSGTKVGKTALVCGIVAALPELEWTAVKITSHSYGWPGPIWEETEPGQGTDTARYLAAGARRALLISAGRQEPGPLIEPLLCSHRQADRPSGLILESNRILDYLDPDICLAVEAASQIEPKPSFQAVKNRSDASVVAGAGDEVSWHVKPVFRLAAMERLSPALTRWLHEKLSECSGAKPVVPPEGRPGSIN